MVSSPPKFPCVPLYNQPLTLASNFGEIKGSSPFGGSFTHRFTDLTEYNMEIESLREQDIDFEAHDMAGLKIPAVKPGAFFCDTIGFQKIAFDEAQTHKPDNLLRVVYVEPNRPAYRAEVMNELTYLQKAVGGGLIEPIYLEDGTVIVANDEAKLRGMAGNRRLGESVIAGPFFVCGEEGDDFSSLTDEEAARTMNRFAEPEEISQAEVRVDMGYTIFFMSQE